MIFQDCVTKASYLVRLATNKELKLPSDVSDWFINFNESDESRDITYTLANHAGTMKERDAIKLLHTSSKAKEIQEERMKILQATKTQEAEAKQKRREQAKQEKEAAELIRQEELVKARKEELAKLEQELIKAKQQKQPSDPSQQHTEPSAQTPGELPNPEDKPSDQETREPQITTPPKPADSDVSASAAPQSKSGDDMDVENESKKDANQKESKTTEEVKHLPEAPKAKEEVKKPEEAPSITHPVDSRGLDKLMAAAKAAVKSKSEGSSAQPAKRQKK